MAICQIFVSENTIYHNPEAIIIDGRQLQQLKSIW